MRVGEGRSKPPSSTPTGRLRVRGPGISSRHKDEREGKREDHADDDDDYHNEQNG